MGLNKNAHDGCRAADSTEAIDWKDLYGRIPDESLIIEFASSFVDNTSKLVKSIELSISTKNLSQLETNAHALKGAAANLGAVLLAKAAWQLENAARNKSGSDITSLLGNMQIEYTRLSKLLSTPNWIDLVKLS